MSEAATGVPPRAATATRPDLRRAPLTDVRAIDFRDPARDFFADEASLRDRFRALWAGLDDAAWRLPGAAPSDAGGPDWSLGEHVAHVADWQEIAADYVERVLAGGSWPTDDDFAGGDFDRFNEARRAAWSRLEPAAVRERLAGGHGNLLALVRRLPADEIRTDRAWGWVYMVLHGHQLDHLSVLEPWADKLRARQVEGDPFRDDPRPAGDGSAAGIAGFWSAEASVFALFDELVRTVPFERWEEPGPTAEWTLKDHVAHLARWFEEGASAIVAGRTSGDWTADPGVGLDAWNARERERARGTPPEEALARFDRGHDLLREVVRAMPAPALASADAGDWAYECLHDHVRAHLAMVGPWIARLPWPPAPSDDG